MRIRSVVIQGMKAKRPLKETSDASAPIEVVIVIPPAAAADNVAELLGLIGKSCPLTLGAPEQLEIGGSQPPVDEDAA